MPCSPRRYIESTPGLKVSEIARGRLAVDELLHVPEYPSGSHPWRPSHDNMVSWLKAGFASGPFLAPPLPNFRCNSILAVPQPGKVRVILNLSVPDGSSFNDNINDNQLERVVMSTARQVGYTIVACGRGARMWKYDLRDAYKNVPARHADFRLQGFRWLGLYFVETQLIFRRLNISSGFRQTQRYTPHHCSHDVWHPLCVRTPNTR